MKLEKILLTLLLILGEDIKSIVFCRVDWFSEYKGKSFNSNYSKNGSNERHETFNFAFYDGYVYGYVRCSNIKIMD